MNVTTMPALTPEPAVVSDNEESVSEQPKDERAQPRTVNFPFNSHKLVARTDHQCKEVASMSKDQLELLKLHYKFGHVSFNHG